MKLVPLGDRVVLKQLVAEETTKSGIVLPGQAKEKPQQAEVIAVGPGGVVDGKEVTMQVKVGDKVTLALVVDYGFGVNWNRNDITYKEYRSGLTYFTLEISSDNSGKTLRLIPQFMDEIVSVYIFRYFFETDKI